MRPSTVGQFGMGMMGSGPAGGGSGDRDLLQPRPWGELNNQEKYYRARDISFNWLVAPSCVASMVFSSLSCVLANFFKEESRSIDKIANAFNQLAYIFNGFHSGIDGAWHNNTPQFIGCNLVSLAGIFGSQENRYQDKAWGSATDQLQAGLDAVATNPRIKAHYDLPDGKERETFTNYKSMWDSFEKTCRAIYVISGDIFNDFRTNGFVEGFKNTFLRGERSTERNVLISSTGIFSGAVIGSVFGLKKAGATVRDIEGWHADFSLIQRGLAFFKRGLTDGLGDLMYLLCGSFYTMGSGLDLIYRWTNIPKLELMAVGFDNLGFLLMTKAMAIENKSAASTGSETQETVDPDFALAH